ncbi:mCG1051071 [Mus musculus]|nr:mCG1051071 [Mus musculus]
MARQCTPLLQQPAHCLNTLVQGHQLLQDLHIDSSQALWRWKEEDQKFKAILSYVGSSRPAGAS